MIIWIIGLSGSGKTTLAQEVVKLIRNNDQKVVLIDGDEIRELFNNDIGHDIESRRINAKRITRLCKFLDMQGIDVICSVLSLFPETSIWCRYNLSKYYEVFIDTPIKTLKARDSKKLYSSFDRGEIRNVVGLDIDFSKPKDSDLHVKNNRSLEYLIEHARIIAGQIISLKS